MKTDSRDFHSYLRIFLYDPPLVYSNFCRQAHSATCVAAAILRTTLTSPPGFQVPATIILSGSPM